ncbi:hypothetical protein [Pilimelia anulata]|uniref:hypothetical protein n=1 Tax=Pilimelia anulata TaxID=53371 RepID=UPI001668A4E5|nr:hypothetical protein [Pilimelia anulata]
MKYHVRGAEGGPLLIAISAKPMRGASGLIQQGEGGVSVVTPGRGDGTAKEQRTRQR